ncbi:hypothetical protein [Luteolibacter yonseiensis]|nr:hypothetical protein [Luteolibacter yonseiensis]
MPSSRGDLSDGPDMVWKVPLMDAIKGIPAIGGAAPTISKTSALPE